MNARSLVAALFLASLPCDFALACEGGQVLFEDRFQDELTVWRLGGTNKIQKSTMTLIPQEKGSNSRVLAFGFTFNDADICVEARISKKDGPNPQLGIMFWAQDYENYFLLQTNFENEYSAYKSSNSKWFYLAQGTISAASSGEFSKIRVVTKGNIAEFYINGQRVNRLRAQAPSGEWQVGLYALDATAEFRNLKITNAQ